MSDNLPDVKELYGRDVGITRRQFFRLAALGFGGAALAACGPSQDSGITLADLEKTAEAEERERPPKVRPPEMPAQVEVEPEPIAPGGPVEREFADSVLVIGYSPKDYPNISETILEIGYKPVWVDRIPKKEILFKYPATIFLGVNPDVPFEGLQTYITQQDGGLIVFAQPYNNSQFNFSGIEYKEYKTSDGYTIPDNVIKFDPKNLTTSKEFIATDIREHSITIDMERLTIEYFNGTISLYLHPSCEADPYCQGIIHGGENTYTESGDIQNPPIVAAREYPAGGRIVVEPVADNFRSKYFGGLDNIQLIRNSLLWVLHELP